jgi:F-type H+-transporting ATPase subunit b
MREQMTKSWMVLGLALCIALTPVTAMAAGGGEHHGFPWAHLIVSFINFGVFLGVLIKFGGPGIQAHFAARREQLKSNLEESQRLREAAQKKLDEYSERLSALETERDALLKEYRESGERERDKLIEEAKRQIEKMSQEAERAIAQETKKAIQALEKRAVLKAVELAEMQAAERLKARSAQDALVDGFVAELGKLDVFVDGAKASYKER